MMLYIKLLKNAFKNAIKGPAAAIDGSNSFNVIKTTIVKIEGQRCEIRLLIIRKNEISQEVCRA